MAMTEHSFTVLLEPEEEGGFTVLVPALPEIVTYGETEDDAIAMAQDAIRLAIAYRRDHGEPVPAETTPLLRTVKVAVAA